MSYVHEWFGDWFDRHKQRHPRADWPTPEESPEFFRGWTALFVRAGVTEGEADEASGLLMAAPPRFAGEHPQATVDTARIVRARRDADDRPPDLSCRESAEAASRDCDDCGGRTGLASRYRRHSRGTADARGHARPEVVVFHCRCALGRWVKAAHARQPELSGRIPDLADHPFLWGHEYRSRPDTPAVPPPPPPPPSRADRLPPLEAPAPTVGEVDGRLVRRQGGQVQVQEAPIS